MHFVATGCGTDTMRLGDRYPQITNFRAKREAAQQAYAMAGIDDPLADIDVAELYDSYSGVEIQAVEDLGFVARGAVAEQPWLTPCLIWDGALPVNASGGLLGRGAPVRGDGTLASHRNRRAALGNGRSAAASERRAARLDGYACRHRFHQRRQHIRAAGLIMPGRVKSQIGIERFDAGADDIWADFRDVQRITLELTQQYKYSLGKVSRASSSNWKTGSLWRRAAPAPEKSMRRRGRFCPDCLAVTEWVELSGEGELKTWSVLHFSPGSNADVRALDTPYVLAYVLLDGADTLFPHILQAAPADLEIGMRVPRRLCRSAGVASDSSDAFCIGLVTAVGKGLTGRRVSMSARPVKLINQPEDIVGEMLEGFCAAYSHLVRLTDNGNVARALPKAAGKVALVIGCGSGHEPAMIGWVGQGLFDVNIAGQIFTAPGPERIVQGIREADRGGGVLVCVSHHAGDLMNAEMALELCELEGIELVDMVVLYDDISSAPKGSESERRGTAGLFFVWKMLGAFCEGDGDLAAAKGAGGESPRQYPQPGHVAEFLRQPRQRRSQCSRWRPTRWKSAWACMARWAWGG